ncbi:MAG: CAP domain-containing protein [bacterium]|nr:CAP domain-containing protein [bacterium]
MKKLAKKYLIAHKDNDGKPHILRGKAVMVIAFVVLFLFLVSFVQHAIITGTNFASIISSVLIDLANGDRQQNGVHTLSINPVLSYAAELKARDMAQKSYFAHTSPEGLSPWYWFGEAGYDFLYAGENLAVNFSDSVDVERAWMNSPLHRKNILSEHFSEIGIGTAHGFYKGRETTFVVQLFGNPLPEEIKAVKESAPKEQETVTAIAPRETVVLGDEVSLAEAELEFTEEEESFVAVDVNGYALLDTVRSLSEAEESPVYASMVDTIFTSPKRILYALYGVLAMFILLALSSFFAYEIRKHHVRHIVYGVFLLVFMAGLFYASHTLIYAKVFVR